MAHSYTPGLKVTDSTILLKRRILPLKGIVKATVGAEVKPDDIVAQTHLPGNVHPINIANMLNVEPGDLPSKMIKKEGDAIKTDEVIAESKGLFGLFTSRARATIDGTIEGISTITGQVLQRGIPIPVEVAAYVDGKIVEVIEEEGVIVETHGALVQGIFGIGGETHGKLEIACNSSDEILTPELIKENHKGKVIVAGSLVTAAALKKAINVGVKGVIVGGFDDKDLIEFLGYDLGVAITGAEDLGITLVVTEGFGQIQMAQRTFDLLAAHKGMETSINGATQIRAGVIRPEVIIPKPLTDKTSKRASIPELNIGMPLRVIRAPYFGMLGKVTALPTELTPLDSGTKARVLEVEFIDGKKVIVPRANVELIEE